MPPLSNDELRDIADESGLSPEQVRRTLVDDPGAALMLRPEQGMVAPPMRGETAAFTEGRLPVAPENAVLRVREAIEREARSKGHMQGGGEADIVDPQRKITYRVRAESDGGQGALVRVDIDPSQGRANRTLAWMGLVSSALILGLGAGLTGSVALWIATGFVGLGGAFGMARTHALGNARIQDAQALAAKAIADAESRLPLGAGDPDRGA